MQPDVTISAVIPTRNRPRDLLKAVDTIFCQTRLPDELVIVDQSVTAESKALVEEAFHVRQPSLQLVYIHDQTVSGLVDAKRAGVEKSRGTIVMFLEDDVELERRYIEKIVEGFRQHSEMMGCCGVVTDMRRNSSLFLFFFHFFHRGIFRDPRIGIHGNATLQKKDLLIPSRFLSGGLSAFRREVFEKVRFDTVNGFFMLEDMEFSTRAVRAFGSDKFFINTAARLAHHMTPTNRAVFGVRYTKKLKEHVLFFKKNRDAPWALVSTIWLLVGLFIEAALATLQSRRLSPLVGFVQGIVKGYAQQLESNN